MLSLAGPLLSYRGGFPLGTQPISTEVSHTLLRWLQYFFASHHQWDILHSPCEPQGFDRQCAHGQVAVWHRESSVLPTKTQAEGRYKSDIEDNVILQQIKSELSWKIALSSLFVIISYERFCVGWFLLTKVTFYPYIWLGLPSAGCSNAAFSVGHAPHGHSPNPCFDWPSLEAALPAGSRDGVDCQLPSESAAFKVRSTPNPQIIKMQSACLYQAGFGCPCCVGKQRLRH